MALTCLHLHDPLFVRVRTCTSLLFMWVCSRPLRRSCDLDPEAALGPKTRNKSINRMDLITVKHFAGIHNVVEPGRIHLQK